VRLVAVVEMLLGEHVLVVVMAAMAGVAEEEVVEEGVGVGADAAAVVVVEVVVKVDEFFF